ncbi:hypothetical protein QQX98_008689 [Neonectria punicea]|uniref:Amino acid transporter transmembrane domain-containing protein n=1 Tax=Neonectria punicea TaxID=979145 RepID=A0ABR1GUN8_9HYPO
MANKDTTSKDPDVHNPSTSGYDSGNKTSGDLPCDDPSGNDADHALHSLGYKPQLARNRSTLQVAFMSFVLASVPYGLATMLYYPILGGGPVNIIWGVDYQSFALAPTSWRCVASWVCGWLYTVGTISITLSVNSGTAQLFVSCVNVFESEPGVGIFEATDYQLYLVFFAITLLCNVTSSVGNRWLPLLDVREHDPYRAHTLCLPLIVLGICCGIGCTTAASRCVWAFARNGAIPGSRCWKQVHPKLDVPLNAMMLSMVIQVLLGLLWFGSSAAFNTFSGVGVISLTTAYASPISISLFTGRKAVRDAKFNLGAFGVVVNVVSLGTYCLVLCPQVMIDAFPQPGMKEKEA